MQSDLQEALMVNVNVNSPGKLILIVVSSNSLLIASEPEVLANIICRNAKNFAMSKQHVKADVSTTLSKLPKQTTRLTDAECMEAPKFGNWLRSQ